MNIVGFIDQNRCGLSISIYDFHIFHIHELKNVMNRCHLNIKTYYFE